MIKNGISFLAYDTLCRVDIIADASDDSRALLDSARALALSVQSCLSMFDAESELSILCRTYQEGQAVPISPMLTDFLAQTLMVSRLSDGALDPTVGPLVRLWDFLAEEPQVPPQKELQAALGRVGYCHLELDARNRTLTIHRPDMVIDPGAVGKGYALDLVVAHLRQKGVTQGVVDFGGNLYVIGPKPGREGEPGRPWRVAIRHPDAPGIPMGYVEMQDMGIATSSWYEHSFAVGGQVYHHLLDPGTGMPVPLTLKSVSILSDVPVCTDLLSTPLFIMGVEKGEAVLQTLRQERGCKIEYVAVDKGGEILLSPGVVLCKAATT